MIKYKRPGLSPSKVVFIYLLALLLVCFHEVDRLIDWAENICLEYDAGPKALEYCREAREVSFRLGLTRLAQAESALLDQAEALPVLGTVRSAEPPLYRGLAGGARSASLDAEAAATEPGLHLAAVQNSPETTPDTNQPPTGIQTAAPPLTQPDEPAAGDPILTAEDVEENFAPQTASTPEPASEPPTETVPPAEAAPTDATTPAPVETPATAPPSPPAPAAEKPRRLRPEKVLIAGDSMILEGLGVALQRRLEKVEGLDVFREGKYSSGLARPDYFDWRPYLTQLLEEKKPDVLIISLGANDPQDILDEKRKRHFVGDEGWNKIYKERVGALLKIARDRKVFTFWVGLPIMGQKKYGKGIAVLNGLAKEACQAAPACEFIDTWLTLANSQSAYTTYIKNDQGRHIRIRAKDKIHVTEAGGEILTDFFLAETAPLADFLHQDQIPAAGASGPASPPDQTGASGEKEPEAVKTPSPEGQAVETAEGVDVRLMNLTSATRGKETAYWAFVPQATHGGPQRFPVLYLLHGSWDDHNAWKDRAEKEIKGLAAQYGLVVILPDGDPFGWWADSPFDAANQIETYFFDELVPDVEARLPAIPGRRAAAGLSMGGHGAFVLALRRPGSFVSVSSMSGIMDVVRHAQQWQLTRVFGPLTPANLENWQEHSAYYLSVNHTERLAGLKMMMSVGRDDRWALTDNRIYSEKLKDLGASFEYREEPGDHDWDFWRSELPRHMAFHAAALGGPDAAVGWHEAVMAASLWAVRPLGGLFVDLI